IPKLRRYFVEMRYKPMPRYTDGVVLAPPDLPADSAIGRLFVQPQVTRRSGETVMLDDALGPWFPFLMCAADPRNHMSPETVARWQRLHTRFVAVLPMTQYRWGPGDDDDLLVLGDTTGGLKAWFDSQPGAIAVLRPDRFVAAISSPGEIDADSAALNR